MTGQHTVDLKVQVMKYYGTLVVNQCLNKWNVCVCLWPVRSACCQEAPRDRPRETDWGPVAEDQNPLMSAVTVLFVPSNCSLSGRSLCVGFLLLDMPFLMTPFFMFLHVVGQIASPLDSMPALLAYDV